MSAHTAFKLETIRSYAQFCAGDGTPAYPLEIFLEVSNICNLKCAMCWQFSALNTNRLKQLTSQDRGFLETDTIAANLDSILDGALLVHCFGFGEPTIHPDFRAIVAQVTSHGAMCDFYTNGMHLDQAMCDFLVEMNVLQIIVSFSGATKEIYENIYIGGNFEQVLAGIERLAATKRARGSKYPVINVNSIGFRDHVARFDDFTRMMTDRGANIILLSHLSVHPHMPYLHEHVSDLRPEQEGLVIARAKSIAAALGVAINASGYEKHSFATPAAYQARRDKLRQDVEPVLAAKGRAFGENPVESFQEIARALPFVRDPRQEKRPLPATLPLDAAPDAARGALAIAPRAEAKGKDGAIYCMEPYKTLYVTRNGAVKPCCEANPDLFLGSVGKAGATAIWNAAGYRQVRDGIAHGEYPAMCVTCLKNKSPPEYYIGSLVDRYLAWNEVNFGPALGAALAEQAPDAQRLIRVTSPEILMERARTRIRDQNPGDDPTSDGFFENAWPGLFAAPL